MIDITPYQRKLTWLQEWIELKVDSRIKYISKKSLYEQTGYIMAQIYDIREADWEFEIFCAHKQQQEANIKYITQ